MIRFIEEYIKSRSYRLMETLIELDLTKGDGDQN